MKKVVKNSVFSSIIFLLIFACMCNAKYSGGDGTAENPYQISSPNDLLTLAADTNDYNDNFILVNDINLAEYTFDKSLIASVTESEIETVYNVDTLNNNSSLYYFEGTAFSGVFDGDGYAIFNLKIINSQDSYTGLIGYVSGGQIKNLKLINVYVEGEYYTGALCGVNKKYSTISQCFVSGKVSGTEYWIGGLCGSNNGMIVSSSSSADVSGYGTNYIGGLCGENGETGIIDNSYATSKLWGYDEVGGLCGANYNIINGSYATGDVSAAGDNIGGLCGYNCGTISQCYATGDVTGFRSVGGLCGSSWYGKEIIQCYATGKVSGVNNNIGGLCGDNSSYIFKSFATGNVEGEISIGGLCGENNGTTEQSYSTGKVTGDEYIGGLCGYNYSYVHNCYSTGDVEGNYNTGGFCGANNWGCNINKCFSTGVVSGYDTAGFCGNNDDNGSIVDCYFLDTAGANNGLGQSLTYELMNQQTSFTNWDFVIETINGTDDIWIFHERVNSPILSWQDVVIVPDVKNNSLSEAEIKLADANLVTGEIKTEYSNITPAGSIIEQIPSAGAFAEKGLAVNLIISIGEKYSGGNGTSEDPYRISNADDLLMMAADTNDYNKAFIIVNDINLAGYIFSNAVISQYESSTYIPFGGVFDGNKHSITKLTIEIPTNSYTSYVGLFGRIGFGGIVKNLNVKDVNINGGYYYTGGLCGYNEGNIVECNSNGSVIGFDQFGGLCGNNYGNIIDCCSTGTISGYHDMGGLCGLNSSIISGCRSVTNVTGTIYDSQNIGGLCGCNYGSIYNCYTSGEITGVLKVGGLCGYNTGFLTGCSSDCNISGEERIGGLCGINRYGTINNSHSKCYVTGSDFYIGGLCGENYGGNIEVCYSLGIVDAFTADYAGGLCGGNENGFIFNCYSKIIVNGREITGGLCGYNLYGDILQCYSAGTANNSSENFAGGLCGFNNSLIANCYSACDVNGAGAVGGLCGQNEGDIYNCYANCDVNGFNDIGGLCGVNYGKITGCYSKGIVSGFLEIGGLCGYNEDSIDLPGRIADSYSLNNVTGDYCSGGLCGGNKGTIENCYSAGNVDGLGGMGGFCGYDYSGSIIKCYFSDGSGQDNGLGEQLNDEQMKQQASFVNWDFSYADGNEAVWFMPENEYPILTWQISPADIYTDGKNNIMDFAQFANYWMREDCEVYNGYCEFADMNFDGYVDIADLTELIAYWLEKEIY